jgi:hypothetical protein
MNKREKSARSRSALRALKCRENWLYAAAIGMTLAFVAIYPAGARETVDRKPLDAPEELVVCSGWHALCSASPDCKMYGEMADCDCLRVNELHIVATSEIQDVRVKRQTLVKCTKKHPCGPDQAPVCKAIRNGTYEVNHVKYDWVSTYSYRGWCSLLEQKPIACDPKRPGYVGDSYWAICDAAPCTEIPHPFNPNKPLSCQCRVESTPFVGFGTCTGSNGGIMSSFPLWAWDFQKNTYPFKMPGYDYIQGACAPLKSDP